MIVYYIHRPGIMVATNPKSGITSTESMLKLLGLEYTRRGPYSDAEVAAGFGAGQPLAFVFRTPHARAVSMYLRFCLTLRSSDAQKREGGEAILREAGKAGITFVEFLRYLERTPDAERDLHYRRQHLPNQPHVLVRTETYVPDMTAFLERSGHPHLAIELAGKADLLRTNAVSPGGRRSGGNHADTPSDEILAQRKGGLPEAKAFLNEDSERLIGQLFAEEIAYFDRNRG